LVSRTVSRRSDPVKGRWNPCDKPDVLGVQVRELPMRTYDAHKTTTEVRQGSKRKMNTRVLLFSTAGVVIAFALIMLVYSMLPPGGATP